MNRKRYISMTTLAMLNLGLLKMKSFTNFGSSTHYIEKMWCVEVSFMIASNYVPLNPLANQVYVNS